MAKKVLIAVPDLLLQSRITEAAKRAGVEFLLATTPEDVLMAGQREKPGLIVLDLESPRLDAERTLKRVRADAVLCAVPTIGFYGHVHKALADRMVTAGLDRAIPRGEFLEKAQDLLKAYAG